MFPACTIPAVSSTATCIHGRSGAAARTGAGRADHRSVQRTRVKPRSRPRHANARGPEGRRLGGEGRPWSWLDWPQSGVRWALVAQVAPWQRWNLEVEAPAPCALDRTGQVPRRRPRRRSRQRWASFPSSGQAPASRTPARRARHRPGATTRRPPGRSCLQATRSGLAASTTEACHTTEAISGPERIGPDNARMRARAAVGRRWRSRESAGGSTFESTWPAVAWGQRRR